MPPVALDARQLPRPALLDAARADWDEALELGEQHGFRNAQVTVLAPTGTIGLVMDCDTTGIEPDFALVKFKKLAGGGYFKIINQSVPAGAASTSATRAGRGRGDRRATPSATARSSGAPDSTTTALDGQGLQPTTSIAQDRGGAADRLRPPLRLQPVDARRGVLHRAPRHPGRASCDDPASTCCAHLGFTRAADRGRQRPTSAAR